MALKRSSISCVRSLEVLLKEVLEVSEVEEVLLLEERLLSSVVSALCAPLMSSLESEEETLDRNSLSGLLESVVADESSVSTCAR
jgi:hypothetical protein